MFWRPATRKPQRLNKGTRSANNSRSESITLKKIQQIKTKQWQIDNSRIKKCDHSRTDNDNQSELKPNLAYQIDRAQITLQLSVPNAKPKETRGFNRYQGIVSCISHRSINTTQWCLLPKLILSKLSRPILRSKEVEVWADYSRVASPKFPTLPTKTTSPSSSRSVKLRQKKKIP